MPAFERGNTFSQGRPKGVKNRLHKAFIEDLLADFQQHGRAAIAVVRIENPEAYLRVIASILPKELEVSQGPAALTDDELDVMITRLKAEMLAAPVEPLLIEHANVEDRNSLCQD